MPFTPFHMGPGILIKALLQGSFSLMVFGWAQIIMDIQPLIVLLSGEGHLHGFTHTYVGATLIGVAAALTGKYAAEFGLRRIGAGRFIPIGWPVTILSAFIGSYSHVLLDSLMHADLQPFAPFSMTNPFLAWMSIEAIHKFCLYSGLAGAGVYFFVVSRLKTRQAASKPDVPVQTGSGDVAK
jgi:membrane-bound metal-dependent hydrolase YbcI (DUF457 family)